MSTQPTFIDITRDGIKFGFHIHSIREEAGNYSCYIPAYDIYFSAPTKEEGMRRSGIMVSSFIKFWIGEQGFRSFVLQILKLGFKAQDDKSLKHLLNRTNINTKMRSIDKRVPTEFLDSEILEQHGELAMAV